MDLLIKQALVLEEKARKVEKYLDRLEKEQAIILDKMPKQMFWKYIEEESKLHGKVTED